ncbi:NnrS family protein [Trinickia diaoshuihuensis]|uniref:NnrS family protein n=1 Tax=Trinickia diaoshuihuensis TaxID=2292265 RepID=UPI000E2509E9
MKISERLGRGASKQAMGLPLLRLGFRPFYLGGALFGVLAVALWLAALHGAAAAGQAALTGVAWHVHEMLFGFVGAIVVGFLLTAVRAWTARATPTGTSLAALWGLWAAGRVLVWTGPERVAALVDIAFLPVSAVVLLRVLIAAKNRHNIFLPVALGLYGLLNALFHWYAWQGRIDLALRVAYATTGLIIMFVSVITGRVVPMFTTNAIAGFTLKRWKFVDHGSTLAPLVTLIVDALGAPAMLVALCALATALLHAARIAGWRSWRVGARPILLILHIACLWIPIGFALLAGAALGLVSHSLAMHALTVGAMGGAIVAMITRTALGHTGRMLIAGPFEVAAYWLMIAAALVRVVGPMVSAGSYAASLDVAGALWCASLVVYLIRYVPYLSAPRIDGKPG